MKEQYVMLNYEVAEMKRRLVTCPLLLEAEEMGFEITIKLPPNCTYPIAEREIS